MDGPRGEIRVFTVLYEFPGRTRRAPHAAFAFFLLSPRRRRHRNLHDIHVFIPAVSQNESSGLIPPGHTIAWANFRGWFRSRTKAEKEAPCTGFLLLRTWRCCTEHVLYVGNSTLLTSSCHGLKLFHIDEKAENINVVFLIHVDKYDCLPHIESIYIL